jgi:hypothetical protein
MRFRKLRIAWSVVCGIACVLIVALWVRSYRALDSCQGPTHGIHVVNIQSFKGHVFVFEGTMGQRLTNALSRYPDISDTGWTVSTASIKQFKLNRELNHAVLAEGGTMILLPLRPVAIIHQWSLVFICFAFAAAPWTRQFSSRFSLRTLLIATTLIAMVLGLIVWTLRA